MDVLTVTIMIESSYFLNTLVLEMHDQFKIFVMYMKPDFGIRFHFELKD